MIFVKFLYSLVAGIFFSLNCRMLLFDDFGSAIGRFSLMSWSMINLG